MSDVFCSNYLRYNRDAVIKSGWYIRYLSGNEHPWALLTECLHGSFPSSGKPQIFVHDGRVLAQLDGTESEAETVIAERHLREAINTVRARQGRPPVLDPVW